MKKIACLFAIAGLAALSVAQPSYLLRIKAKPGQSYKYAMNIDQGAAAKIAMQMTMKVAKVQKGETTLNTTMGNFMMNGQPAPPAVSEQMKKLLIEGRTDLLHRFISKKGRPFSAFLVKGPDGKVGFEFAPRAAAKTPAKPAKSAAKAKTPARARKAAG
jgi:hypothetical protein